MWSEARRRLGLFIAPMLGILVLAEGTVRWMAPSFPPFEYAMELGGDRDIASKVEIFGTYDDGSVSAVVAGASDVLLSFDPAPLEEMASGEVINVGVAGSTALLTERFLTEAVVPLTNPKVVFWGVKELSFIRFESSDPAVQEMEREQLENRVSVVQRAVDEAEREGSKPPGGLALRTYDEFLKDPRILVKSFRARLESRRVGRAVNPSQRWRSELGWMDRTGRSDLGGDLGDDVVADLTRRQNERSERFTLDLQPLLSVAEFLGQREIPLVIVIHGMRSDLTRWAAEEGIIDDFEAAISDLAQIPGVFVVDHRSDFEDSDFSDQVHFKYTKTEKYSESFARSVQELCRTEAPIVCERLNG
jgi:hypothetical protein